jgi:serine/threonine-protein kinase
MTTRIINLGRLRLARKVWMVLVAFNILYGVINLGFYTAARLQPCVAEPCLPMQLSVHAAEQFSLSGVPFAAAALLRPVLEALSVMVYCGVSIVLFRRRSGDWMGVFTSLTLCLQGFQLTYSIDTLPIIEPLTLPINLFLTMTMLGVAYTVLYLFPSGRFTPRWSIFLLLLTLAYEWPRGILINLPESGINSGLLLIGTLVLGVVGLSLQVWRYRLLSPVERQQVKWVIFAFFLLMGGLALSAVQKAVIPSLDGTFYVVSSLLAVVIQQALYLGLPLAFAFSMLRYRLWDADLAINKTLVYASSVVVLIVMFWGLFFTLNAALISVIGANSTLPLILSVIVVAGLFTPVSRRLARFIDHQVYGFRVELFDIERQSAEETHFMPVREAKPGRYTGTRVGAYDLGAVLGKGAMSEVYAAQDTTSGQVAAVKLLPPELSVQAEARLRFQREAEALRQLNHPNVVRMLSSGMSDGIHYLAMELVDGQNLLDRLNYHVSMTYDEAIAVIRDVAAALDASHAAGIIHRDVKPSNVLLHQTDKGTRAVLTDFGIVKLMQDETASMKEAFIGTPYYVAPEQITASKMIDHRADIYALGIVAYQLLTGRHPFKVSRAAVVFAHLNQPPPDPRSIRPDLSRSVVAVLLKALAKDPDDRYQSAGAFAEALMG